MFSALGRTVNLRNTKLMHDSSLKTCILHYFRQNNKSKTPLEPYVENFVFSFLNVVYGIRTIEFEQFKNNKL